MDENFQHVTWFRDSSPYIQAHRGKTFVVYLDGAAILHPNFTNIIGDILLLHSLGVRLVLVHGSAPQIDAFLAQSGNDSQFVDDIRVTTPSVLTAVQYAVGKARLDIEAALSRGVVNAPKHGNDVMVMTSNAIKARPLGIINGQDYHHTGRVRRVNGTAILRQIEAGAISLISHMGYSPTGELFNINSIEVAGEVARAISADKLILFTAEKGIMGNDGTLLTELEMTDIVEPELEKRSPLRIASQACRNGVNRCHLISYVEDGALLQELFTRDGSGTQVVRFSYERIRQANAEDVAGIIELIEPLEQEGILVKRSRELIESEIEQFLVIDRDGMIIGCAALYSFGLKSELACLAVHPEYRDGQRGADLLKAVEKKAKSDGAQQIFALTTQTGQWFVERGFRLESPDTLPETKRSFYNYKRNSTLFTKKVS